MDDDAIRIGVRAEDFVARCYCAVAISRPSRLAIELATRMHKKSADAEQRAQRTEMGAMSVVRMLSCR